MEQIVIHDRCSEGPRHPSLADIERALANIEYGRNPRPEFSIERLSKSCGGWVRRHIDESSASDGALPHRL